MSDPRVRDLAVALRPLRPSDWPAVEPWLHDPETSQWMVMARASPSAERWCRELAEAWPRARVMAILAPTLVGIVGLFDIDWLARKAEFRIVLGSGRGQGIGAAATRQMLAYGFQALNLHRIWLGTAEDNLKARACFTRAGFRSEGVLRDDFWHPDGVYIDNVRYAILRSEWEAAHEKA